LAVLEHFPDALTIFIQPASVDELERRLRDRGTETDEALARRLEVARRELAQIDRYRYRVVNRDLEQAAQELCDILVQSA
jgi:guanylate kinase